MWPITGTQQRGDLVENVTPEACNSDIFKNGKSVAQIVQSNGMRSWHIEDFIKSVAAATNTQTDWHYSGGIAQVLTLGDAAIVVAKIKELWPAIQKIYPDAQCVTGLPARYRAGVDEIPDDVIGIG